jgi:formylmethanofuran dehydrogenase subunit E
MNNQSTKISKICDLSIEEYTGKVKAFHGSVAPGMILAGIMVDLAMKNLPAGEFFDVICETQHCLVDAVQILTPCTIGNGWIKLFETSRFSLTFYNKNNGDGMRVFVDSEKIKKWSEIRAWFSHEKDKSEQDAALLLKQLSEAGYDILSLEKVHVKKDFIISTRKKSDMHVVCPSCHEMYYKRFGELCPVCGGSSPYDK